MKRYASVKAVCPYYKNESRQVIYCTGLCEGNVIHLAFANASECIAYKKLFCRDNYERCPVAKMLEEVEDERVQ
jgi:hypothetical protein